MKKPLKKTALTQTIQEYASHSSIHGISYAFDRELNDDNDNDDDDNDGDDEDDDEDDDDDDP